MVSRQAVMAHQTDRGPNPGSRGNDTTTAARSRAPGRSPLAGRKGLLVLVLLGILMAAVAGAGILLSSFSAGGPLSQPAKELVETAKLAVLPVRATFKNGKIEHGTCVAVRVPGKNKS